MLVPAALRLDPDEVDKKDTDYDDYRVFEGRHYRISKKDEEAFKELHWLNYGGKGRRRKRYEAHPDEEEEGDVNESMKLLDIAKAEKHKKAAEEREDALWTANGEQNKKKTIFGNTSNANSTSSLPSLPRSALAPRARVATPIRKLNDVKKQILPSTSSSPENVPPNVPPLIDLTVPNGLERPKSTFSKWSRICVPRLNPLVIVLGEKNTSNT
ncbi:hypothetical protein OESDEN_25626, partial [Oesophagostomum dentatum]